MSWRAVVDVGTLSTSLLLTDGSQRSRRSVDTFLGGASIAPNGEVRPEPISAEALAALGTVLASYRTLADEREAEIVAVSTAVARRAPNRPELEAVVGRALGVDLEVVPGDEEARLAFLGVCSDAKLLNRALGGSGGEASVVTFDLGGGSVDVAIGTPAGANAAWSMPIGGSLVSSTYLEHDPPRPEELSAALSVVELHVDDLLRELPQLGPVLAAGPVVFGMGGVVTVAMVEVGLIDGQGGDGAFEGDGSMHGFELTREAVDDVFRTVATEARADRLHNPGLPPSRVDVIVGGCAVLVEIMRQLDLERVVVSQRGLADGVAARHRAP